MGGLGAGRGGGSGRGEQRGLPGHSPGRRDREDQPALLRLPVRVGDHEHIGSAISVDIAHTPHQQPAAHDREAAGRGQRGQRERQRLVAAIVAAGVAAIDHVGQLGGVSVAVGHAAQDDVVEAVAIHIAKARVTQPGERESGGDDARALGGRHGPQRQRDSSRPGVAVDQVDHIRPEPPAPRQENVVEAVPVEVPGRAQRDAEIRHALLIGGDPQTLLGRQTRQRQIRELLGCSPVEQIAATRDHRGQQQVARPIAVKISRRTNRPAQLIL